MLQAAFKWAQMEGFRSDDPMSRIENPFKGRRAPSKIKPLTAQEVTHLLSVASTAHDPYYERWAFQLLHGTRQGETLGLTEEAIDFDNLTVDISWQLQWLKLKPEFESSPDTDVYPREAFQLPIGYECKPIWHTGCLVRPKTHKSRVIPLAASFAPELRDYLARVPRGMGGLIWSRQDGKPVKAIYDVIAWKEALQRAGLKETGTHISRHTANTLLRNRGVQEDLRMQILGHSTATANRGYTHVDLTMAREAMGKLGDLLPSVKE